MCITTESSATGRVVDVNAVAGSTVSFNCTLHESCRDQSFRWVQFLPSSGALVQYSSSGRINPSLVSTNISVEDSPARGRSVLTIPTVRLADRGQFQCRVSDLQQCQMDFRLSVTGNNYRVAQKCHAIWFFGMQHIQHCHRTISTFCIVVQTAHPGNNYHRL